MLPDRFRLRYFLNSQAPARVHRDIQSTSRPFGTFSVGAQAAASKATATPYVRVAFFAFGRLKARSWELSNHAAAAGESGSCVRAAGLAAW